VEEPRASLVVVYGDEITERGDPRPPAIFIPAAGESGLVLPRAAADLILPPPPRMPTHYFVRPEHQESLARIDKNNWIPSQDGGPLSIYDTGWTDDSERAAKIVIERPEEYRLRRPKETIEEHHLVRYMADFRREFGTDPFTYTRGADPPDFQVELDGQRAGVDVTQLLLQDEVARQAQFRQVKSEILMEGPAAFRHLRGLIVYLALDGEAERNMRQVAPQCIRALRALSPQRAREPNDPEAGQAFVEFERGVMTSGRLLRPAAGAFYGLMGFELAVMGGPIVREHEAWDLFERLVYQHDKPGVENLLVPVMAPAPDGYVYSSSAALFDLIFHKTQNEGYFFDGHHVRLVLFHLWPHRTVFALWSLHGGMRVLIEGHDIEETVSPSLRHFRYFGMESEDVEEQAGDEQE
jgi:hypothetical protein